MQEMISPISRHSLAGEVFRAFLDKVIAAHVFSDAERNWLGVQLSDEARKKIAAGTQIDGRTPYLAAISGKGGWHKDPEKAKQYARWTNISLLDHLCSVVRGALVFAETDLRASGVAEPELWRRLAVIAAIAFLHDADKILQKPRSEELTPEDINGLAVRYGVDRFLGCFGRMIEPTVLLACIDEVEVTRTGRMRPGLPVPPRELLRDCKYVQLADRLDGKFLDTDWQEGGADAVVRDLERFAGLRTEALKQGWKVVRIYDPHSTFLLDEFQRALSNACTERHGLPPLIELHHDGQLICIVPEVGFDALIADALKETTRELGASIRLSINNKWTIELLDARATVHELRDALEATDAKTLDKLLSVKIDLARTRKADFDSLFESMSFLPRWPDMERFSGARIPLFASREADDDRLKVFLLDAQLIACTLSCANPGDKSLGIPGAAEREQELSQILAEHTAQALPDWLAAADDLSRRATLAALAAAFAQADAQLRERLLGEDGLVALWLEGRGERKGLNAAIDASGARLAEAVRRHFTALASGRLIHAEDEDASGRCHFTNMPVAKSTRISKSTGLYALKVSAFSGREGRPEPFWTVDNETLVAPIAEAEYRLRQIRFGRPSDRREVPVLVSSPVTAGLFPALVFDRSSPEYFAFSDILRRNTDKGKLTFNDIDGLLRRLRVARYEELPTRLTKAGTAPGQLTFIKMAFEVARRTGRPVHIFRGLPRPETAFVAFDFLPPAIEALLGGRAFRLEQINEKIRLLQGIEMIADETGFGLELALAIADPRTRFGAACDALARCQRREDDSRAIKFIREFVVNLIEESKELMSNTDRALVAYGEAMAKVQRAPRPSDGGNYSDVGLRIALEAVQGMTRMGQTSPDALKAAVAGELKERLARRGDIASATVRPEMGLDQAIEMAAHMFVHDVWLGAFKGQSPTLRTRRIAMSTYRWAFEHAAPKNRSKIATDQAA